MLNTFMIDQNIVFLDRYFINDISLYIVRDDIYPFVGGGSKARKALAFEKYLQQNGYNAVVTCGGIQSNHNRAIALMCARNKWKCHLCIQGVQDRFNKEKGNALLDRVSGATCELINPEDTSVAMDRAMNMLESQGYKPYYVIGGGHNLPGGTCFVEAIKELKKQCDFIDYKPDYIILASGTGSTQAGIIVGLELIGWGDVKCIGISVARNEERGKKVISDFANMLADYYGLKMNFVDKVLFTDDYLCGGYEQYTRDMQQFLLEVTRKTGLVFDTTYSGKALYGMMDIIAKNPELKSKNILFWHTGGIMNIMK